MKLQLNIFLTSALDEGHTGGFGLPYPGKEAPSTHCIGSWVHPNVVNAYGGEEENCITSVGDRCRISIDIDIAAHPLGNRPISLKIFVKPVLYTGFVMGS